MPPTLQRKLILTDESLCPMITIEGARERLPGHDEDDILALIEEGAIEFAWNIGLGERREVRMLKRAVEFCAATGGARRLNWSDARVAAEVLKGSDKPWIEGVRLKLLLNCSSTQVISLVEAKALAVMPGTSWDRGPGNSPQISTESFKRFLVTRRIL